MSWESSADATSFRYCYDTTNDGSCAGSWLTTTSTTVVVTGLSPNSTYYWQVEASNLNGTTGANGGTWYHFGTLPLPGTFSKQSPSNKLTNLTPTAVTLAWEASENATTYQACYDTIENNVCDRSWITTTTNSLAITGLLSFSTYTWQIRAINSNGETSANDGTWWSFTTSLGSVTPTSPINGASASPSPSFVWGRVNGATWYFFQIQNSAGVVFKQWYDAHSYCTSTTCTVNPARGACPRQLHLVGNELGECLSGPGAVKHPSAYSRHPMRLLR